MVNIAVLVSGGGTNLQALLDAQARGELGGGRICAVISSRAGAYALERACLAGVPAFTLPRREFADEHAFCRALEALLAPLNVQLLVHAGFLCILDDAFCKTYENRMLNVHPSLIPAFCGKGMYGLRVHEAALAAGVKVSGATVHFVTPVPDGGPIVAQRAVDVLPGDTPEALQARIMRECEHVLLPRAVALFCEDRLRVCGNYVEILPERSIAPCR